MKLHFITNEQSEKIAVQIPIKEWERLQGGLKKLTFLVELKQAFHEMEQYKKGKLKTISTQQLLSEL